MNQNIDKDTSGSESFFDHNSLLVKLFLWLPSLSCWKGEPNHRGRPLVYPWHAIFRGLLFMILKHLRRIPALDRALRQCRRYQILCGFESRLPCQRTWYRRFQQLKQVVRALKAALLCFIFPNTAKPLRITAVDGSAVASYGRHVSLKKQNPYKPGDKDARWGKTVSKGWFQGYKIHCLSTTRPCPVPLAWEIASAASQEANHLDGLLDEAIRSGFSPRYVTADKAYDADRLFQSAQGRGVFLAAILRKIRPPTPESKKATLSRPFRERWSQSAFARYVQKCRSDIERWLSHLKETFLLDPLPVRHQGNVTAYVQLCLLGYLTLVAFNLKHGRPALKLQDIMCSF